jgi:hypothetical protein
MQTVYAWEAQILSTEWRNRRMCTALNNQEKEIWKIHCTKLCLLIIFTSAYLKTGDDPWTELMDNGRSFRFLRILQSSSYFCITSLCCSSPVPYTSTSLELLVTENCKRESSWSAKHFTDSDFIPACLKDKRPEGWEIRMTILWFKHLNHNTVKQEP